MTSIALRRIIGKNRSSATKTASIPAPVGGWNARDNISDMRPEDAVVMDNWFPGTNDVRLRKGYTEHVTGIGSQVETLMNYSNVSGTETLFAAAGTAFYDVTTSGAVGSAVQSSLSNAKWYFVNFTNSGGTSYLCAFNGTDKPRYWDNSNWISIDNASTPAITGVTTTGLIYPFVHKRRMWIVEKNTLKVWYLPVDSVGGAASAIDLAGIVDKGGHVLSGGSWTIDGGSGLDDLWVAVTSKGQVVVYKGTDPSNSSTWSLVGVWNIAAPIGRRCLLKYRGDLLVICDDEVYPLSKALQSTQTDSTVSITDRINSEMNKAANDYGSNFGWELFHYPKGNMLLLNVPVSTSVKQQFAMNTITGRWARFKDIPANTFEMHANEPYFGGDGVVYKFWTGFVDVTSNIRGDIKQAFNYFGSRGRQKAFTQMRPILLTNGQPSIFAGLNVDYGDEELKSTLSFSPITAGTWDNAVWDVDVWGGDVTLSLDWQSVNGIGYSAAPRLISETQGIDLRLEATDVVFRTGGIIG